MSGELSAVPALLLEYERDHVSPALKEFEESQEAGTLTEGIARRCVEVLEAYRERVRTFPGSPNMAATGDPDHDALIRPALAGRLAFIDSQLARVLKPFGGYLRGA